eukprot:scaffold19273_cov120-Skeletonema_marinoi.AAC.2
MFSGCSMCLPQWSRFLALKLKKLPSRSCHRFTGDCLVLRHVPVHMFESLIDFVYYLCAKSAVIPLIYPHAACPTAGIDTTTMTQQERENIAASRAFSTRQFKVVSSPFKLDGNRRSNGRRSCSTCESESTCCYCSACGYHVGR